jgi:hypothetical protein
MLRTSKFGLGRTPRPGRLEIEGRYGDWSTSPLSDGSDDVVVVARAAAQASSPRV